jgi:formate dehydrogenase subunit gamma
MTQSNLIAEQLAAVQQAIEQHQTVPGGLLPCLHAIQDKLGFIPPSSVDQIAQAFAQSRAQVHGVITFYYHFRYEPVGRTHIQICVAESCKACGSDEIVKALEAHTQCTLGTTTADGAFSLNAVYCLGLCANSPAIQINEELFAGMDRNAVIEVLSEVKLLA